MDKISLTNGTDQHLARQLLDIASGEFQRAADTGAWFQVCAGHWERCADDPCDVIVARVASKLKPPESKTELRIAEGTGGDPLADDEKLFARLNMQRQASGVITKMRAVSKALATVREDQMDADPFTFWAGGRPYSLRTLEPHGDPDRPHLLTAGYAPASGDTPLWDALNDAQFPDGELRDYALALFGCILPGGSAKLLPNFKADGNLGKTLRLMLLVDLLGTYAVQLPAQLLGNFSGHDEMYLRLKGKRLAWMDETPPSSKVAAEKLKHLSGGGQLTGRAINGRAPVEFTMQHTLMLAGNDDLPLTDPNVVRRVRYLPITGEAKAVAKVAAKIFDHGTLSAAWRAEAPAVLWKLMIQAQAVLADRSLCDMPMVALDHFADAIMDQDTVTRFVNDCCTPGGETSGSALYEAYVSWCQRNAIRQPVSMTLFGRRLTEMGHAPRPSNGVKLRPLRLLPTAF